jgi:cardiolipin synthase
MSIWENLKAYGGVLAAAGTVLGPLLTTVTIIWILATKKNATSAVAWCLFVFFLPLLGPIMFMLFGYQHVSRPLSRKRQHKRRFQRKQAASEAEPAPDAIEIPEREAGVVGVSAPRSATDGQYLDDLGRLAQRFGAYPVTSGNHITLYHEGRPAFDAMFQAIQSAREHIHVETFILQPDETGRRCLAALTEKARQGVEVRLLYDAMGSRRLSRRLLQPLRSAGGKCSVFLPINPFRRRIQVNMRNHRKILVVDGRVAFTGGLNIGDEYLSKDARFGFWRDTHLRVEGPAADGLQQVFVEDWDFAAGENLQDPKYFPTPQADGPVLAQVIESGPDREFKGIREVYFAAALRARKRLWIASPYFVPDAGLLDALCLAGYMGVDVRLLGLFHPDKWIPYFAARYYWEDVLNAGVKVYQYTKGMMHAKVVMVDGEWASVGTANLDNRSLYLNFEVNCLLYSADAVARLEEQFRTDLTTAIRLERHVYGRRPFAARLIDNTCRLLSPIL